ncbi:CG7202 [Drosophila busckii]|uniref:CG7202 n=1 Tax=Drosophila busckii TaxID=30019 RepID=A0A0M5J8P9_DROBS|nr:CG7202 [Drosophila busckii]
MITMSSFTQYCPHQSPPSSLVNRAFELLINYGLVLIGTIAVTRLLSRLEQQAGLFNQTTSKRPSEMSLDFGRTRQDLPQEQPANLPTCVQQSNALTEQLDNLQMRFRELQEIIKQGVSSGSVSSNDDLAMSLSGSVGSSEPSLSDSSSLHCDDDSPDVIMWRQPSSTTSSFNRSCLDGKVYVTHSHIHLNFNGPVQLSKTNFNINSQRRVCNFQRSQSEFLQVWKPFIEYPQQQNLLAGFNNMLI